MLVVKIEGPPGSGKSWAALIIEKALRDAGANVTLSGEHDEMSAAVRMGRKLRLFDGERPFGGYSQPGVHITTKNLPRSGT